MNVLAFFAHPDDETMLAGGTLALLAREGVQVHYVCATRGEGGELGEPPLCSQEELGEVREQELVCAVQALQGRSLTFLGHVDPTVSENDEVFSYSDNLTFVAGQLTSSIKQFEVQAVLTHGSNGEYGHPAHRFTFQAALVAIKALAEEAKAPLMYSVSAFFKDNPRPFLANQDDPAHLVLDISSVVESKQAAAMCHRTQHALFVRRLSIEAGHPLSVPEVIVPLESLHRVYPPVEGALQDPLADLLAGYATNPD